MLYRYGYSMNNVGHCGLSEPNHISFAKNIYKVRGIREENRLVYIIDVSI